MEIAIRRRLLGDEFLCGLLAKFGTEPAIFYQKAPYDTDVEDFYPHLIISVDTFYDAQKGLAGLLSVDIITSQAEKTAPEEIERRVRKRLEGVFLKPTSGEIFSLKWQRSDVFTEPASERTPLIIGVTTTFDIYEFPLAETNAPDPVESLNTWAKQFQAVIIGISDFGDEFEATREIPAIYFDAQKIRLIRQENVLVWFDATLNLHLFAPDVRSRREWLAHLNHELATIGRLFLNDGSPMDLLESEYLWAASEIQGQIQLKFRYGVPNKFPYAHTINHINFATGSKIRRLEHVHDTRTDCGVEKDFLPKFRVSRDGVKT